MKFTKTNLFAIIIIISIIGYILLNGSRNLPLSQQKTYDNVPLIDDPERNPWFFDFDFQLPEFNIPLVGGIFSLGGEGLTLILLIFVIMLLLFIGSLIRSTVHKRRKDKSSERDMEDEQEQLKELKIRRIKLGTKIEELIIFLKQFHEGPYDQPITIGFEKLDLALKEYSRISRPSWLTPREFSLMKIPYFNYEALINAVELFYRITYGQKEASKENLDDFIYYLEHMIEDEDVLGWQADLKPSGS